MSTFWTEKRGKDLYIEALDSIDTQEFKGTPGHALLLIAANRHLSVSDLEMLLIANRIERSRTWIYKRRWLFQDPTITKRPGGRPNEDGKDAKARTVMRENTTLSLRDLVTLLDTKGIKRSREWVRMNRCG